jgi:hypothetical protein
LIIHLLSLIDRFKIFPCVPVYGNFQFIARFSKLTGLKQKMGKIRKTVINESKSMYVTYDKIKHELYFT